MKLNAKIDYYLMELSLLITCVSAVYDYCINGLILILLTTMNYNMFIEGPPPFQYFQY